MKSLFFVFGILRVFGMSPSFARAEDVCTADLLYNARHAYKGCRIRVHNEAFSIDFIRSRYRFGVRACQTFCRTKTVAPIMDDNLRYAYTLIFSKQAMQQIPSEDDGFLIMDQDLDPEFTSPKEIKVRELHVAPEAIHALQDNEGNEGDEAVVLHPDIRNFQVVNTLFSHLDEPQADDAEEEYAVELEELFVALIEALSVNEHRIERNPNRNLSESSYEIVPVEKLGDNEKDQACPICQTKFSEQQDSKESIVRVNCGNGHLFCQSCIKEAFQFQEICPTCRAPIQPKK